MKLVNFEKVRSIISNEWPTYSKKRVKLPSLQPNSMSPSLGLQRMLDT